MSSDSIRSYLVTGATGAIGQAIARGLAATGGRVVLVARDEAKAERTVRAIRKATDNESVDYLRADLARPAAARELAVAWSGPLDVLVNNAAICPRRRAETEDGVEMQFAVNVLGYVQMIEAFAPLLARSAGGRIVNVASYWAGDLDAKDLEFKTRRYDNDTAYRQSKQADRMLSAAYARRLEPQNIRVNACHPGDVTSNLSRSLGFGGSMTPDQGAATPLWLATSNRLKATGRYYEDRSETADRFCRDASAVDELYEICSEYARRRAG